MSPTGIVCPPPPAAAPVSVGGVREDTLRAMRAAATDMVPIMAGLVPFALVIAAAVDAAPIGGAAGWVASGLIFAGSAQLAAITAFETGASALAAVLAGVLVNTRLLIYSASLAEPFSWQSSRFRWLAPHFLVDFMYVLATSHDDENGDPAWLRAYWLMAGTLTAVTWLGTIAIGITADVVLPEALALDVIIPVVYIGLLMPRLTSSPPVAAAVVGAVIAVVGLDLPAGFGLVAAALGGLVAAAIAVRTERKAPA